MIKSTTLNAISIAKHYSIDKGNMVLKIHQDEGESNNPSKKPIYSFYLQANSIWVKEEKRKRILWQLLNLLKKLCSYRYTLQATLL